MKIKNDKYYTPEDLAKRLIETTIKVLANNGVTEITDIIEPSAGNGSFSKQIKCTAYDIEPEAEDIIKADYLTLDIPYKKGRLIIGNPPFGHSNALSVKFYQKSCEIGDYIAFIQPIVQLNNRLTLYQFDLIYSEDLGVVKYSGRDLHCCFNIYKRPENGLFNKKPDYTLKDITIKEYRRGRNNIISPNYDYNICIFGNVGKVPAYVGQYSCEAYFYCHKKEFLEQMIDLLSYDKIRAYTQSISGKRISVMRLYKYLKDNIKGIE